MRAMISWFENLDHVLQALLATCFTWFVTAAGAMLVFFFKRIERRVLDAMLGFAAGVMIAASFWSLLDPAIEMAEMHFHDRDRDDQIEIEQVGETEVPSCGFHQVRVPGYRR